MKALGGLAAHLQQEAITLATCWRVVRQDGAIFTFTDHDRPLILGGEVYQAQAGYQRTAVANASNGAVDNLDLEGVADQLSITDADILRGLWDYAEIRVFVVNWAAPEAGQAKLRRGWLGEVSAGDTGLFRAELRGLAQALMQRVGQYYTPECKAQLGDARCKVDLGPLTDSGTVSGEPVSSTLFDAAGGLREAGWYTGGVLEWTSGFNAGVRREVLEWDGTRITLFLPSPYRIAPGDGFTVVAGCQKRLDEDCVAKFGNATNFRGEPFTPGADTLLFVGFHGDGTSSDK